MSNDCYRCGTANAPDALHCKRCGAGMVPAQPYDRFASEDITCPFCGRGDDADAVFCDQCGKRIPKGEAMFTGRQRLLVDLAGKPGSYRPPAAAAAKWKPTTQMRKSTLDSMRKLQSSLKGDHEGIGAHVHVGDAVNALSRGDTEAATRHLTAAIGNMTPQSLLRHGYGNDEDHMKAKANMDNIHRHLLLVKDIESADAQNAQLPPLPGSGGGQQDGGAVTSPNSPVPSPRPNTSKIKAMNSPTATPSGGSDPAVAQPKKTTTEWKVKQVAASNSGDLTTAVELTGPGGWSHGWHYDGVPGGTSADALTRTMTPHRAVKSMSADDLHAADNEFARRAALLGKPGQLSRAHKAVKDELAFRSRWPGGGGAARPPASYTRGPGGKIAPGGREDFDIAAAMMSNGDLTTAAVIALAWQDELRGDHGEWIRSLGDLADKLGRDHPANGASAKVRQARDDVRRGDVNSAGQHLSEAENAMRGDRSLYAGGRGSKGYLTAIGNNNEIQGHVRHANAVLTAQEQAARHQHAGDAEGIELSFNPLQPRARNGKWTKGAQRLGVTYEGGKGHYENAETRARAQAARAAMFGPPARSRTPATFPPFKANANPDGVSEGALARIKSAEGGSNSDWRAAIANYDKAVAAHNVTFDRKGYADQYPGKAKTDQQIANFISRHVADSGKGYQPFVPVKHGSLAPESPPFSMSGPPKPKPKRRTAAAQFSTPVELSAKTGALASTPHPFGKPGGPGLWHQKGMELPPYIQNIAHALLRTGRAKDLGQAIAIARGATKRWAAGGGHVHPEVRAASAATSADWDAKRARAHAHANIYRALELTGTAAGAAKDQRVPAGQPGGGTFGSGSGSGQGQGQKPTAHQQHMAHVAHQNSPAGKKDALLKQAASLKSQIDGLTKQRDALVAAHASASGKTSKGQSGSKTSSGASKTASTATTKTAAKPAASGSSPAKASSPSSAKSTTKKPSAASQIAALNAQITTLTAQYKQDLAAAAAIKA